MTSEYKRTLCDIDLILENLDEETRNKVPNKFRELIHQNKLEGYESKISTDIPIESQQLENDTLNFLAMLYLKYWCENETEKVNFKQMCIENEEKYQEELREKYNPDNMFKKNEINEPVKDEVAIIEFKEKSVFMKIVDAIKKFFCGV